MDESPKIELLDIGTRWEHYTELRDLFAIGIEILKNLSVKNSMDWERQRKLENAVEMINARLNLLSDYVHETTFGSKLRRTIEYDVEEIYRKMQWERKINEADDNNKGS